MNTEPSPCWPSSAAKCTHEPFTKFGTEPKLELSSFRGRAVPRASRDSNRSRGAFVFVFLPTDSRVQRCRPRSKRQVGFGKEDQHLVSASATAKNASCCPCAQRRLGIRDRDRLLPSSRPPARSLCGHTTRSRLADGEAGRIPCVDFTVTEYAAQAVQIG